MSEEVLLHKAGHTAIVTLNHPEHLNALSLQMKDRLREIWTELANDDDVWVVVLTGAGNQAFCAGADVKSVKERMHARTGFQPGRLHGPVTKIGIFPTPKTFDMYKPVICAVNGVCTGAGLQFVTTAEIVICSQSASFFDSHVSRGYVTSIDPVLLTRRIPYSSAMRMALMGNRERVDAKRALELGLVTEVVESGNLQARALEIAETLCTNAPIAMRKTVEATWRGLDYGLTQALELATLIYMENWITEDFSEGTKAFLEKRQPVWRNR